MLPVCKLDPTQGAASVILPNDRTKFMRSMKREDEDDRMLMRFGDAMCNPLLLATLVLYYAKLYLVSLYYTPCYLTVFLTLTAR